MMIDKVGPYAIPSWTGEPTRVEIVRLTLAQGIDSDGGRWWRSNGRKVGAQQDRPLAPWGPGHDAAVKKAEDEGAFWAAKAAIDLIHHHPAAQAAALPHLKAAVEAARLAKGT